MAKRARINNDLQHTTQKTKGRATRTPVKLEGELRCSRRISSSCFTSGTHRVTVVTNPVISHERENDREVSTHIFRHLYTYDRILVNKVLISSEKLFFKINCM
jgi:hypothetical protein